MSELLNPPPLKDPACRANHCWQNVAGRIKQFGGEAVRGWAVAYKGDIIHLVPHVVWRSPEGTLYEITPITILNRDGSAGVRFSETKRFLVDSTVRPQTSSQYLYDGKDRRYLDAVKAFRNAEKWIERGRPQTFLHHFNRGVRKVCEACNISDTDLKEAYDSGNKSAYGILSA
ncbi:hypothetical protein ETAA8_09530 [Anatilimnocola aggregata]|uniref:Uncharacterized protein n=1 Tax=Anatilimnocola aggregata TaxID=2528021 RepID=A0A517Y6L9_9BACT|nr:hypothetical protein [Anatilimnocola aggregata]QDU25881.1 hypothetical protein ETAA8_09530 [Anatilimnocola aggregata]